MKLLLQTWAPLGLLLLAAQQSLGHKQQASTSYAYQDVTVVRTVTITTPETVPVKVPVTHVIDIQVTRPHYVDVTSYATIVLTQSTTTTLHFTEKVTDTKTELATVTNTLTSSTTVTRTDTTATTITTTDTTATTITNTETTTTTVLSIEVDPCPKSCSISAATVNLYFWPTDRPATYPTTYVHPTLGYTFTSPSVYIYVPTAHGTKSNGERAGPATASWMIPQRLEEVSTIDSRGSTVQLTLSDLRTDCPQTAEPSEIATMINSACDPVLAAPKTVSKWAFPCNACGRFGLFDPPYAVPTLPGGLVPTTAPPPPPPPPVTSAAPIPTSAPPPPPPPPITTPATLPTTTRPAPTFTPSTVITAAAAKTTGGLAWLVSSVLAAFFLF